ncbi:uncharacterized protein LOC135689204 [Rhopilema esculentum]|uniref:uncharacterized protein LOC135689204 n=1 Tax=Rhopilema esculentum TaxID=499914 RepID=UPI0031CE8200
MCVKVGTYWHWSLMAEYDEFLAEVISLPGRATKYLSAKIQNMLIHLLANTVSSTLVENIDSAPFWSIILDSTSDITKVDQLTVVTRWRDLGIEAGKGSLTLKKLCTTRWSSRIDALRAVRDKYPQIMRLLMRLILTANNKNERDNAKSLKKKIDTLEFIIFLVFWERILRSVNAVSKELHSPRIDLSVASRHLNIALSELQYLRESWQSIMLTATALAKSWDGSLEFQQKRGRKARYESDELVVDGRLMDPEQSFKINVFYKTVDTALMQLTERFKDKQW